MGSKPKPFTFALTDREVAQITEASGEGGHQELHRKLTSELAISNSVTLDDSEFGMLVRYMTQYGSGGFQSRLRHAFDRPIRELFGY